MELPIYVLGLPARKMRVLLVSFGLIALGILLLYDLESRLSTQYWSQPPVISIDVRAHRLRTQTVPRPLLAKPDSTVSPNSKVLLLKSASTSKDSSTISAALQAQRIAFISLPPNRFHLLPSFLSPASPAGPVNLIIFEQFLLWTKLPPEHKTVIDNYCRKFGVGVIGFLLDEDLLIRPSESFMKLGDYPLLFRRLRSAPSGFYLTSESPVLNISRGGQYDPATLSPLSLFPQRVSVKCRSNYSGQLATTQLIAQRFADGLPNYDSVLRRQRRSCDYEKPPACCLATLVPPPDSTQYFQTVAFTKLSPLDSALSPDDNDDLHPVTRQSCAFSDPQDDNLDDRYQSLVIEDVGGIDGIKRVLFAYGASSHWSVHLLLMDAVRYLLSSANRRGPLEALEFDIGYTRWVHVDIDDIFVANPESQLYPSDVEALLAVQREWRKMIPGFTFSLGFSGGHYGHGSAVGRAGDAELLRYARHFKWFCHTWSHSQPHLLSESDLLDQLMKNKEFATVHNLPIQEGYAVAPHHSGVYPVLPSLFRAWKKVWGINVTTTEGYPRLFPAWNRRGFAYDGVQVIPRQTSGVYTQTLRLQDYPGGAHRLQEMALGGEVFQTLLYTPVSFFMTHFGNYGQDRLAAYVLNGAFRFLLAWTRLQLKTGPPNFLAQQHLAFHRQTEAPTSVSAGLPLQSNPCADRRHAEIWPPSSLCDQDLLPSVLIGGPQKTGTTALLTFMAAHPDLVANHIRSQGTFEEPQFFSNNQIYAKGVAWYFDQFPRTPEDLDRLHKFPGERQLIRFEKSATYFDSLLAPDRVLALLSSRAKLIFLLKDPLERAYSWYQHQRSHRDEAALRFTFAEVLRASSLEQAASLVRQQRLASADTNNSSSTLAAHLLALNRRCLRPGHYALFLEQWLLRFPPYQILLLDADQLVSAPAVLMDHVQEFLNVGSYVNYSSLLQFDKRKRFFCLSGGPHPAAGRLLHWDRESGLWCLSRGKGRSYPPLVPSEENRHIFRKPMQDLYQLLLQRQFWRPRNSSSVLDIIPSWLQRWIHSVPT